MAAHAVDTPVISPAGSVPEHGAATRARRRGAASAALWLGQRLRGDRGRRSTLWNIAEGPVAPVALRPLPASTSAVHGPGGRFATRCAMVCKHLWSNSNDERDTAGTDRLLSGTGGGIR